MNRTLIQWGLIALGLLFTGSGMSAEIILTATAESVEFHHFTRALGQLRPEDHVYFVPLRSLPAPAKLPGNTRLIVLDPTSLDWRLSDSGGPPTLGLHITRLQARKRLPGAWPRQLCLLWSDPSLERQLRLIQLLLPKAKRIGVLYGLDTEYLLPELQAYGQALNMQVTTQRWDSAPDDNRPLHALLHNSDVLLGLDDPALYNPETAKNLLLTGYGRQRVFIGPSAGFVQAGSLATTYSDLQDTLLQINSLLDRSPEQWPSARYPQAFKVSSNRQVAQTLGLMPINNAAVAIRLTEGAPTP